MKKLLGFLLFLTACAQAQTIRVPIELSFEMPIPTNGTTIINQIITNVYQTISTNVEVTVLDQRVTTNTYITNITFVTQITTNASTAIVTLPNNVVDWKLGTRLYKVIVGPTAFTAANFGPNTYVTLYYKNPSRFQMTWPTGTWWMGSMPTNQARGAILFENINGELWATP